VILQRLEDTVVNATADRRDPLWLVGHSLGGVICLDYATDTTRRVDRLVTVGSQPGLLGEWGVLRLNGQAHGDREETSKLPLPPSLESGRWLNVYDQNDVLSFLAEPVFTGVVDIPVDTHAPFPVAHSAYWNCAEVYSRLVS
jgi:pimeloyl-ACP methyl ester carboxylesterase